MADKRASYPVITQQTWWRVRTRFKASLPSTVTPAYLHTVLGVSEKTARDNELPILKKLGLVAADGSPTERARRWRDDEQYRAVCEEIIKESYPRELTDAVPDPAGDEAAAVRWFMHATGVGQLAAQRMARTYRMLFEADPTAGREATARTAPRRSVPSATRGNVVNDDAQTESREVSTEDDTATPAPVRARVSSDELFRLPGSSYDEIVRIIKAYGHYDSPVDLSEVSQVAALHPTSISRNNGFLVAVGVLDGGKQKALSKVGRQLARALDHDMTDEIRDSWLEVVLGNEFFRKLLSAIRIRKGMETSTLQAHIAYTAGLPKNQKVATGAATVVDILRIAGAVRETEGKLQAAAIEHSRPHAVAESNSQRATTVPLESNLTGPLVLRHEGTSAITIALQIQIQCKPGEIETLGPQIRRLLKELGASAASD